MNDVKDLRKTGRRRTIFGGMIFVDEGDGVECVVADISEAGARVKTDLALEMGSHVDLRINKYNDLRRAKVVWVRQGEVGLEFDVGIDSADGDMARLFKIVK